MKQTGSEKLREEIATLQGRREVELKELRQQVNLTYESLKLGNLLKSAISEITESSDVKNGVARSALGAATGMLARKIVVGGSHGPIRSLIGLAIQFGLTNLVSKNVDSIKTGGLNVVGKLFDKFKSRKEKSAAHNGTL